MNLTYQTTAGIEYTIRRSKFAANYSPVIVSDNMSGKMAGIPSISTSVLENPICQKRREQKDSICSKCFAANTAARYSSLAKNLKNNLELLTGEILPLDVLPRFILELSNIVRFESFGDLANVNQAINYLNIARVNPGVRFAIWTKNIGILAKAVEMVGKPDNVRVIYSSPIVNHAIDVEKHNVLSLVLTPFSQCTIKSTLPKITRILIAAPKAALHAGIVMTDPIFTAIFANK